MPWGALRTCFDQRKGMISSLALCVSMLTLHESHTLLRRKHLQLPLRPTRMRQQWGPGGSQRGDTSWALRCTR